MLQDVRLLCPAGLDDPAQQGLAILANGGAVGLAVLVDQRLLPGGQWQHRQRFAQVTANGEVGVIHQVIGQGGLTDQGQAKQ
ncbi:hypothetical protein D3C77_303770 [compost metagenome]